MAPFVLRRRLHERKISNKRLKLQNETMQERLKRLTMEMAEIGEEQKKIREGQGQVREKFEAIESECEKLKRETKMLIQQSARTQAKLAIMFMILKAREASDFATASNLTQLLRQIADREKQVKAIAASDEQKL